MTPDRGLVQLELENQIASNRAFLAADPVIAERYGLAMTVVAGLPCSSCRVWDSPLFNRALGAGVLGPLEDPGLAAIGAEYDERRRPAHVEVYESLTPPAVLEVLRRGGYAPLDHVLLSHLLEIDSEPPIAAAQEGVTVERIGRDGSPEFAAILGTGFEATGALGEFFVAVTRAAVERLPEDQLVSFLARVDGVPAGTGMLILTERVAGLYSGSVLPQFRGRGIQHQLIAARLREGLRLGRRIFVSQTEGDNASAHNLHDVGFRTLYRAGWWAPTA